MIELGAGGGAGCRGRGPNLFLVLNKADKLLTGGGQSFGVPGPGRGPILAGGAQILGPPLGKFLDPGLGVAFQSNRLLLLRIVLLKVSYQL